VKVNKIDNKEVEVEKFAITMHCNLRPPDVMPVVLRFNYEARNILTFKFNNSATATDPIKQAVWDTFTSTVE